MEPGELGWFVKEGRTWGGRLRFRVSGSEG